MKPQIVLDTNVLVAASRSRRGAAFRLVSLLPAASFEINLIVTYNTRDFRAAERFGIAVATPTAFLEAIGVLP